MSFVFSGWILSVYIHFLSFTECKVLKIFLLLLILFEMEMGRENLPSAGLVPHISPASSSEPGTGLPHGQQGLNYLNHLAVYQSVLAGGWTECVLI